MADLDGHPMTDAVFHRFQRFLVVWDTPTGTMRPQPAAMKELVDTLLLRGAHGAPVTLQHVEFSDGTDGALYWYCLAFTFDVPTGVVDGTITDRQTVVQKFGASID